MRNRKKKLNQIQNIGTMLFIYAITFFSFIFLFGCNRDHNILGEFSPCQGEGHGYDSLAVATINNLINNNGLQAMPDEPETWSFALWNNCTPRQIVDLFFQNENLTGNVFFYGLPDLKYLSFTGNNINDIYISDCFALKEFGYYGDSLIKLLIKNSPSLEILRCNFSNLTELDVTQFPNLKELHFSYNNLSELDLKNCSNLQWLSIKNNNISKLDVGHCNNLHTLYCENNKLTELNVKNCSSLKTLWCHDNNISKLDLSNCTNLESLSCSDNIIAELDLTKSKNLTEVYCYKNLIPELDVSNCFNLTTLTCADNKLTQINVTNCNNLRGLFCHSNMFSKLDLTGINLDSFCGSIQTVPITMFKNSTGEYFCEIYLNNPIFDNSAISYSNGILKSTDSSVESTEFTVKTGSTNQFFKLEGTIYFTYQ